MEMFTDGKGHPRQAKSCIRWPSCSRGQLDSGLCRLERPVGELSLVLPWSLQLASQAMRRRWGDFRREGWASGAKEGLPTEASSAAPFATNTLVKREDGDLTPWAFYNRAGPPVGSLIRNGAVRKKASTPASSWHS